MIPTPKSIKYAYNFLKELFRGPDDIRNIKYDFSVCPLLLLSLQWSAKHEIKEMKFTFETKLVLTTLHNVVLGPIYIQRQWRVCVCNIAVDVALTSQRCHFCQVWQYRPKCMELISEWCRSNVTVAGCKRALKIVQWIKTVLSKLTIHPNKVWVACSEIMIHPATSDAVCANVST